MRAKFFYGLLVFAFLSSHAATPQFVAKIRPISKSSQERMKQYTWHQGCPLALNKLARVEVTYWGFDQKVHQGILIIHRALAKEVVTIFRELFNRRFPFTSMQPMDAYWGDDKASMAANNTSGYNCREVTDRPGEFSQHSYGRAIDINPLINPYVKGTQVQPAAGKSFVNRQTVLSGKINKNSAVYRLFKKYGWDWGGDWFDVQDYQHFEKRAHGEKRNPYGYGK